MATSFTKVGLRDAMISSLPLETSIFGTDPPPVRHLYFPRSHVRALHPDNMLVQGMRGAGKSLWWAALQFPTHRDAVCKNFPSLGITGDTLVSAGYGENLNPDSYPSSDVLHSLLTKYEPKIIWKTIILKHACGADLNMPEDAWGERIEWVKSDYERCDRALFKKDNELRSLKKMHLILFDALDRTSDDWGVLRKLARGLLQVILELRSLKSIRAKAFLRPDMFTDESIISFPDSSKVISNKVELSWPRFELYNLLWQYIGNSENSALFRDECLTLFGFKWVQDGNVWVIPEKMRSDEKAQRKVFHAITGPWMGRDHRRGFPYTWLVNHLGDAHSQTSPRSFLAALRKAVSDETRESYDYALHYESIKKGVQEASAIRVREVVEDYPWVSDAMMPSLIGLNVPCNYNEIENRWLRQGLLEKLKSHSGKLPPSHLTEGYSGVKDDLVELGIFQIMNDERINMPDVYRIGFSLKRKGGVKPIR